MINMFKLFQFNKKKRKVDFIFYRDFVLIWLFRENLGMENYLEFWIRDDGLEIIQLIWILFDVFNFILQEEILKLL